MLSTTLTWVQAYEKTDKTERIEDGYHILSKVRYFEKNIRLRKEKFTALNEVTLNPVIVENLLEGKTKPYLFKEMIKIKSDSAIALYTALDV